MLIIRHEDGPLAKHDLSIAAPYVPERLIYGYVGEHGASLVNGYLLVGTDKLPMLIDELLGQSLVEYVLDRDASDLRPHPTYEGMETGTAVYRLAHDAE